MSAENQVGQPLAATIATNSLSTAEQADRYAEGHDLYGYVTPAGITKAEAIGMWVDARGKLVWNACGDERPIDPLSEEDLMTQAQDLFGVDRQTVTSRVLLPSQAVFSSFGNVAGMAQNTMAVGIMHQGPEFYERVGGMEKLTITLGRLIMLDAREAFQRGETAIIPSLHTATVKERELAVQLGTEAHAVSGLFVAVGNNPTGCARNELLGQVSYLTGNDERLRNQGQRDVVHLSNNTSERTADIADGHGMLARIIGEDYRFARSLYARSGLPVMSLQRDGHLPPSQTDVIVNYALDEAETKGRYYTVGLARAVYTVRRALREMEDALPAADLMTSFVLADTTTRGALASGDPRQLPVGFRGGSMESALDEIARRERNNRF